MSTAEPSPDSELPPPARARPEPESLIVEAPTPERDALMRDPSTLCLNCGQALPGAFCPSCGQKAQRLRQPVHLFLRDAFVEFFGLDGRVWKTLGVLLFKPGRLTRTYLDGRRVAYLRPLRIYLSSTLLFFVLLATLDPVSRIESQVVSNFDTDTVRVADHLAENDSILHALQLRVQASEAERDSLLTRLEGLNRDHDQLRDQPTVQGPDSSQSVEGALENLAEDIIEVGDEIEDVDSDNQDNTARIARMRMESALLSVMPPDSLIVPAEIHEVTRRLQAEGSVLTVTGPEWLTRSRAAQQVRDARTSTEWGKAVVELLRSAIGHIPTVMFIVLPVFALILKVLYVRRDWYYSEHLVFGLHTHAFAFVIFCVIGLVLQFGAERDWSGAATTVLALSIPLYFLLAQKHVYRQGWIRTVIKAWILGWIYLSVIGFGLVVAVLLAAVIG